MSFIILAVAILALLYFLGADRRKTVARVSIMGEDGVHAVRAIVKSIPSELDKAQERTGKTMIKTAEIAAAVGHVAADKTSVATKELRKRGAEVGSEIHHWGKSFVTDVKRNRNRIKKERRAKARTKAREEKTKEVVS